MNPNRKLILDNLQDLGSDNFQSIISGIYSGIQRLTTLSFPASSWENARKEGYTFTDMLDRVHDNSYSILHYITIGFPGFNNDPSFYMQEVVFSGLWRSGSKPHSDGRGIDITMISVNVLGNTIFNNVAGGKNEDPIAIFLRNSLFPATGNLQVSQYLSPWKMCLVNPTPPPPRIIRDNNRKDKIDVEHLNHLHLTIFP